MKKLILILLIVFPFTGFAQSFNASVDNTKVGINDRFQVSFTFSGKDINGLKNFQPPSFVNFMVLSGPNQSTSIQFINGAQSASITYSFIVQPKSLGTFSIGTASIDYNGKTFSTKPLKITVIKGSAKPKSSATNSGQISNEEIAKNLFIRAIVDKRKAYLGEQVTVTYKLYTRLNIAAQMSINKLPKYEGFWAEELETSNNISFNTEMVNGKQFRVGILKKVALFPTKTGKLQVTPFELTVPVQIKRKRNRNNFFDDFFNDPFGGGQTIEYNAVSDKVNITVLPLPEEGKPESFHGAVGNFTMDAQLDKSKTKTNEPVTLKVKIKGTGNIELLDVPEINVPNGFEKYEPKTSEKINRINKISGTKTAEYLMVPRVVGKREIPPIEFSFFNPARKKYVTLKSPPFKIDIEQGEQIPEASYTEKEDVQQLGDDIRFIKTSFNDIHKKENWVLFTTQFWLGGVIPLILLFVVVGIKRRHDKLAGNLALLRYQKAQKIAKNRLKKAKKFMQENNSAEFYTEISQALFGYLEDKLHIPKAEFTIEHAIDELKKSGVQDDLLNELKQTAEDCEFVRFAPGAEKSTAMQTMYDKMTKLIINVEKNLIESKNDKK